MKKNVILLVLTLILLGGIFAWNEYNRGPVSLEKKKSDVSLTAPELLSAFQDDENAANAEYLDKVVEVTGVISSIENAETVNVHLETEDMMSAVICELAEGQSTESLQEGSSVTIKGQCTGYLMDVILVKAVIVNTN